MWKLQPMLIRWAEPLRTYRLKVSWSAGLTGVISLCLFAGAAIPAHAAAIIPKLDMVRIALFIDTGKYSSPASEVTLSAENGLGISIRNTAGMKQLFVTADQSPMRAALDSYSAVALETADPGQAKALAKKLDDLKMDTAVVARTKLGKPVYQLVLGPYATKEAAAAGLAKAAAVPDVSAASKGLAGKVSGPLHWIAGTYVAEAEAGGQVALIEQAGYEADVAYLDAPAGAPGYAVMVSGAADGAALDATKLQLSTALPAVALQPVDPALSYVLKRTLLDPASTTGGTSPQLLLGGTAAKLAITSPSAEPIKVLERSERAYRGLVELSKLNSKLAVINELPFEQYLVSVVSSELSKEWPLEALKAQAVAARTFALKQGTKYQIAHLTDTTLDQAYKGATAEFASAAEAVKATAGEVITDQAGLITPLYYSNAGGLTAESTEVWGNKVSYLQSTATPDEGAEKGKAIWYQIVLPNGNNGYIHSSYAKDTTQKNPAGLPYYESSGTDIAVRPAPYVDNAANPASFKVNIGDRFVVIGQAVESNAYSWIRGPYDADKLKERINTALKKPIAGVLEQLEVSKRGASGRVIEMKANGQVLETEYPDAFRTLLNGLPSTRFEIEETGRYTILGADGVTRNVSAAGSAISIAGAATQAKELATPQLFVLNGDNKVRMTNKNSQYIFKGTGFGHGLGMSQWGAKGYAELGYDYKKILQTFYTGVSIIKE
ncbi:SpoIID/LytB domain-containing protein [Paenibacillus agricola]|uniref:SpoIID/LytB domain-containing protein n=1 Tax=Paenibacillus agricola TaxID=2716264 RepID=A0ABX0J7S2_9BACL|nr:SpoIID/LytB domain-containing protein [Paenibacillus agricola]NHN30071.1 SpoIID/LytB domain-containing protein [Paenibacillus agricola]